MNPIIKIEIKNFTVSLAIFIALFLVVYFSAISSGADSIDTEKLPLWQSFLGISIAVIFLSIWITLIIHCFKTNYTKKSVAWGLALIFLQWLAMVPYILLIYIPSIRNNEINS
jgi:hypothetical protein